MKKLTYLLPLALILISIAPKAAETKPAPRTAKDSNKHGPTIQDELVNTPDIYPTMLQVAGLPFKPEQHMDGKSFYNAITGKRIDTDKAIFWHHPHFRDNAPSLPASVVRKGNYKLIRHYDSGSTKLFDLANDPSGKQDLSQKKPEMTKELNVLLDAWLHDVDAVIPQKNSNYDPEKAKTEIWGGPGEVARRKAKMSGKE